ncbi:MAG: hypothetical protein GXX90_08395, partial [Microbacteriaceae bacterium]|nr:hypothetical protein [Microbacteriaceae bacterium]
ARSIAATVAPIAGGLAEAPAAAAEPLASTTAQSGSTLAADAAEYTAGATIELAYATDAPHAKNWIGVYPADVAPGTRTSLLWTYTPDAAGTAEFVLDLPAGDYRAYLLARDGYGVLGEPVSFAVVADPDAPVPGDPTAPVEIDPVVTEPTTDGVLLREGFDGGALPEGWTATTDESMAAIGVDRYRGWTPTTRAEWPADGDAMRDRFARVHESFVVADAAGFGEGFDATLGSAPVDVAGLAAVRLTFDSHYRGAAAQTGTVTASFDGGEPVEVLRLDAASVAADDLGELNAMHDVVVEVPAGAERVEFAWRLVGGADGYYWGVDSVAVHRVLVDEAGPATSAWIVSDIQGHPHDLETGIGFLHEHHGDAAGLLMVGDIVNSGTVAEWDEVVDVMGRTEALRPATTVAAMGNHERYAPGGFVANRDRFLAFADRERVWYEDVLEGPGGDLPVIVLGQEFASPSEVAMSEEQVRFLEERLAHWTELGEQVLVLTHFPLGSTVSGSWIPWYSTHHQHNDRLTSILGNYPNAIVLSGHTHYDASHGDWAVQRRTADGRADGFWAVNTLAMHNGREARGESTSGITEVVTRDVNSGLALESHADRTVITAYDFATGETLREITIPNPLVEFDARLAPEPVETEPVETEPGATDADDADGTGSTEPAATDPGGAAPADGATTADRPGAEPPAGLASTGADSALPIGVAALAALAGGALLVARLRAVDGA